MPPKPLSSVIAVSVLSLRTVMCVRCVASAGAPLKLIEQDQLLGCVDPLIISQRVPFSAAGKVAGRSKELSLLKSQQLECAF